VDLDIGLSGKMAELYGKKMTSDEFHRIEIMHPVLASKMKKGIIKEIQAFASEYGHSVGGRDVIIVEQLIDFLDIGEKK
jgi:hypothetical protein